MLSESTQIQIDIIHDLRQENNDPQIGATPAQIKCLAIALTGEVGEDYRIPVLRALCEYGDFFTSSKQLTLRDASVLIDWLCGGQSPGEGVEMSPEALDTLHELKRELAMSHPVSRPSKKKEEVEVEWY